MSRSPTAQALAPVAIVGAGPTGLSLALGLARQGVRSILIERKTSTSEYSKAPGIHLRTREIFRQWGFEQRVLDAGSLIRRLRLNSAKNDRPLMTMDFSELDDEADRAGILILEQGKTEKLLLETVRESGMCEVMFGAEAVAVAEDHNCAQITICAAGVKRSIAAEFAAGCDGASSFVRKALNLPFDGITYSMRPLLADVRIKDKRDALPWPRIYNGRGGLTAAIRLSPGLWRIIRLERGDPGAGEQASADEVNQRMTEVLDLGPFELVWASRFRIHRRSSPRFRKGRVLLAGDAAHVHSPAGGQGMNAGIQDAHNLAWKLACALRGGDIDRLLDSYDVERRAVVVGTVSRYTDFITRAFLQAPALVRGFLFFLASSSLKISRLRKMALRRTTMIDLGYPPSPLLDRRERCAGVRVPNPRLRSPQGINVRLYDLLGVGPVILDVAEHRDFAADLPVERVIRIGRGEYFDSTGSLRRLLGGRDGWILARPDTHIAWARNRLDGIAAAVRHALG